MDLLLAFRYRVLNSRDTEDWTMGGCRRLDGFWLRECLVVRFLGFGVEVRCLSCGVGVVRFFFSLGQLILVSCQR